MAISLQFKFLKNEYYIELCLLTTTLLFNFFIRYFLFSYVFYWVNRINWIV